MPYSPVLGQIMPFAGTVIPKNWAPCSGQLMSIQQNQALFSLLGTYYGGNGTTNFALPDLRGRAILGSTGNAGQYPVGTVGGSPTVTLIGSQLPAHNHLIQVSAATGGGGRGAVPPTSNVFATNSLPATNPTKIFATAGSGDTSLAPGTNLVNEGRGQAHNNMQPYLTISYLIALQGIYPSRN
ncbi:phage tail protein [Bradyrhizobium sp. CCBAU 53338]|uniref:phage tail protein n=1 Tax=Bradyrhizobium sp. CCBAU 53338 TaxID=1325111 RepID=UPI00188AB421|nr:tail fiber protein [Bradyrhizobium sp. CCBAU 53338]QOZ53268.1 phage tail protein [Bradyrhizobium sp. CCBAU 53338]